MHHGYGMGYGTMPHHGMRYGAHVGMMHHHQPMMHRYILSARSASPGNTAPARTRASGFFRRSVVCLASWCGCAVVPSRTRAAHLLMVRRRCRAVSNHEATEQRASSMRRDLQAIAQRAKTFLSSCPALCRASTSSQHCSKKDVDGRETLVLAIRQRRIALPGHDEPIRLESCRYAIRPSRLAPI